MHRQAPNAAADPGRFALACRSRKALSNAIFALPQFDRREFPRIERGVPTLLTLEPRRMMSATPGTEGYQLGSVTLVGDSLHLDADRYAAAHMDIQLDADASHVRGVIESDAGLRHAGDWVPAGQVRRVVVAGGDAEDTLELDGRLGAAGVQVNVADDVERVHVNHAQGDTARARRFAASVERSSPVRITLRAVRPDVTPEDFEVGGPPRVAGLHLARAGDDRAVGELPDVAGQTFDRGDLGREVSILADVWGERFQGSVRFNVTAPDGQTFASVADYDPLSAFEDGAAQEFAAGPGEYTITATAFSGRGATGESGGSTTARFRIAGGTAQDPTAPAAPLPAGGQDQPDFDINLNPFVDVTAVHQTVPVGHAVHFSGMNTTLSVGAFNDATFEWDFGDPSSGEKNRVRGFVSAHEYRTPGDYTATLRVTGEDGRVGEATYAVTVTASERLVIHVDAVAGDDANDGGGTGSAVKSVARAMQLLDAHGDHAEILFRGGQEHYMNQAITVQHDDVVLGAYGGGGKPTLVWTGPLSNNNAMVESYSHTELLSVRGLKFDNFGVGNDGYGKSLADGLRPGGRGTTVSNNVFVNVATAVSGNFNPTGLLVSDNSAPSETGLRAYLVWGQGQQLTVIDNYAVNSTREHIVRAAGDVNGITVAGNDFTNLDRRNADANADQYDTAKGVIVIQHGDHAYVSDNDITGPGGVGPLGSPDGLATAPNARFDTAVWEYNRHHDGSIVIFEHGAQHVDFRFNTLRVDNSHAIQVDAYDPDFDRAVVDLTIHGNLVVNQGTTGKFAWIFEGTQGLELTGNTYAAVSLQAGAYHTAAILIEAPDLSGFSVIDANTWPAPTAGGWTQGGNVFLGTVYDQPGFLDPAEWNGEAKVGTDYFTNTYGLNDAA